MTSIFRMYNTYSTSTFGSKPTVGDTKLSLVGVDHVGWLLCDGRTLNQKDYYFLYQVIGTTYGSNASTTFKLPNPAGYVLGVIGSGIGSNGSNLTPRRAGEYVGEETHTLTIAEMPTHNHPGSSNMLSNTGVYDSGHSHSYTAPGGSASTSSYAGVGHIDVIGGTSGGTTSTGNANIVDPGHTHTLVMSNQGGSNSHNTMQPTLFIGNMFIFCGLIEGKVPTQNNGMNYPFGGNGIY